MQSAQHEIPTYIDISWDPKLAQIVYIAKAKINASTTYAVLFW